MKLQQKLEKHNLPLKQDEHGYTYGIEGKNPYIYIPFEKIEWFLWQLTRINTWQEQAALCSFNFDYPDGLDAFYAPNYPYITSLDKQIWQSLRYHTRQIATLLK